MTTLPEVLIVGAGFAGSVCARELADAGFSVRVIDKRPHIGGNAWDAVDAKGVLIHPYGPHIFHTNSKEIFDWLSRFTQWRRYEHRVLARVGEDYYPLPINRTTINKVFSLSLAEPEVAAFLDSVKLPREAIRTSEDLILGSVGSILCEMFFRNYSRKQWGLDLSELSAGVAARLPVRTNDDDRYFQDTYQYMPKAGYAALFTCMLDHPRIEVVLGRSYEDEPARASVLHTVYTGPIDGYYGYVHGHLPYRSLRFEHYHVPHAEAFVQPAAVVNYPGNEPYTRITEFRQLTGQEHSGSSLMREFPCESGDPYYPVPNEANARIYQRYKRMAETEAGVTFVGRLAQYQYYNMDQVVASALSKSLALAKRLHATTQKGNA